MYQILEIIGTSSDNYSAAAQDAVDQAVKQGFQVHFVEVVQQRGAVENSQIQKYQAVVKVGGIK